MSVSSNASIEIELGIPTSVAAATLTNSGDNTIFNFASSPLSRQAGYEPVVMLAGLKSGGAIAGNATVDEVDVSSMVVIHGSNASANASGEVSIGAGTVTLTRATTASFFIVNSITVKNDGTVNATVGLEGAALSATRGAAGGPPLIPVDSIEIGQVKLEGTASAVVATATEVFSVPGVSQERHNAPLWTLDVFAGTVTFNSALPLIHVGPTHAEVYASFATPEFSEIARATDWVPAEQSASASSTTRYQGAETGRSITQNSGSFTIFMEDGITDPILGAMNDTRWLRFKQNKLKPAHRLENAYLTLSRQFPADNQTQASVTFVPEDYGRDYDS